MTEKMNVHKALCELKLLDSRINKEIGDSKFVVANKHNNQKIDGQTIGNFCALAQKKYQSIRTLINRRNAIKQAVVLSNANTRVEIAGKTYTVAEAIDMKAAGSAYLRNLLTVIREQFGAAARTAERENGSKLEDRADTYMTSMFSGSDMKNMSEEIKKVREAFIASQTTDVVDAIGAQGEIDRITAELDAFAADVDSALSVSNALTQIEVNYETL